MDPLHQQGDLDQGGGGSAHADNSSMNANLFAALKRQQADQHQGGSDTGREHKRLRGGDQGLQEDESGAYSSHDGGGGSPLLDRLREMQAPSNIALDPTAAAFANNQQIAISSNQLGLSSFVSSPNNHHSLQQQSQHQMGGQFGSSSNNSNQNNHLLLNDSALRAELTAQLLRHEQARRANAALISVLGLNNTGGAGGGAMNPFGGQAPGGVASQGATGSLSTLWPNPLLEQQQQQQQQQDPSRLAPGPAGLMSGLSSLDQLLLQQQQQQNAMLNRSNEAAAAPGSPSAGSQASASVASNPYPFGLAAALQAQQHVNNNNVNNNDLAALMIQQLSGRTTNGPSSSLNNNNANARSPPVLSPRGAASLQGSISSSSHSNSNNPSAGHPTGGGAAAAGVAGFCMPISAGGTKPQVPPCHEGGGSLDPYTQRGKYPLGIDEDPNWLSEFHCFVRSELVEVYRASRVDCKSRNNAIAYQQVGIRCRFCAHKASSARAGRSSAFPSSLRQIYQSFTMMLRDHFGNCDSVPTAIQERFLALKDKPAQGATDSKRFWIYSAMKLGMTDSSDGIMINERTVATGASLPPFGTSLGETWPDDANKSISLVLPSDKSLVSDFMYTLLSQVQIVRLTEPERIGNRRSLAVGLPGFSCRACYERRRLGLCRMFPARRRTLPAKFVDLHDHMRRCTVTPQSVKDQLSSLQHQATEDAFLDRDDMKEFFDRIWDRLGHASSSSQSSSAGGSLSGSGGSQRF